MFKYGVFIGRMNLRCSLSNRLSFASFLLISALHRSHQFAPSVLHTTECFIKVPYAKSTQKYKAICTNILMSARGKYGNNAADRRSLPIMPSQTFLDLVLSQFELLSDALYSTSPNSNKSEDQESKIKSIALYLPQENAKTGQLEFVPLAVYPTLPKTGRVFIASDASSGLPPTVPPILTQLPGFAHAETIIPTYPFTAAASSNLNGVSAAVGTPEEVLCDRRLGGKTGEAPFTALSLPLFSGPQTIGVLLIWGKRDVSQNPLWTERDIAQIRRTGETLAIALCMDANLIQNRMRTEEFRVAIADNLHQVKNPVQALRTFTKLLKRNIATAGRDNVELGRLVDDMVVQSDRIVQNLIPFDSIMNAMDDPWSYQKLLASPMEEKKEVIIHPKLMPTSSYLGELSPSKESTSQSKQRKVPYIDDDHIQIAFLPDILQHVVSAYQAMSRERDIEFSVHGMNSDNDLPGVMIYPRALQEAVSNVLDNALKYVKLGLNGNWGVDNFHPMVRITLLPNDDILLRGVTILVEDNGPGIPLEERESVFQRGFRGVNARSVSDGSGIGLEYSRLMVEKMGGSLSLQNFAINENSFLRGTVVQFILYGKSAKQKNKLDRRH